MSSITQASVILTLNLWFIEGIFVGWLRGGLLEFVLASAAMRTVDWVVLVILGADTAMRFSGLLRSGSEYHLGFCEWLWPKARAGR